MNRVLAAWREIGQDSLNIPNLLTLTRILLIPVFVVLFVTPDQDRSLMAAIVFVVAAVTDMLDGYLARRSGQVTKLGKLLDPIADKLLVEQAPFLDLSPEAFAQLKQRILAFIEFFNQTLAKPFRWTYIGKPLMA